MKETPILQEQLKRRDPMTLQWRDKYASLSNAGLLVFKDELSMKAMDISKPPQNMIGADDIYSVTKHPDENTRLSLRTRDHVMHELCLHDQASRNTWCDRLTDVQRASRRYKALDVSAEK